MIQGVLATLAGIALPNRWIAAASSAKRVSITDISENSSLGPGDNWESLNPGYWQVKNGRLRRQLKNAGDRARATDFPFHYESQSQPEGKMPIEYDPSLPLGIIWNRDWWLTGSYQLEVTALIKSLSVQPETGDDKNWRMYQLGWGVFGLSIGGKTQFESFYTSNNASAMLIIRDDGRFGLVKHSDENLPAVAKNAEGSIAPLKEGDRIDMLLTVSNKQPHLTAEISINDGARQRIFWGELNSNHELEGYFGLVSRGHLDVEIADVKLDPQNNQPLNSPLNECHTCYPLGDTLVKKDNQWYVTFVALFRNDGKEALIRISDEQDPSSGWENAPIAGRAAIINNQYRRNSAIIDVVLPSNPAVKTLYYTIWKDGKNVTSDSRIGSDSIGPGTGLVGDVPVSGNYVGRLPRLQAPYKICGLSCHAIHTASYAQLPDAEGGRCGQQIVGASDTPCGIANAFYVHDQPCYGAYKNIGDYDFQIMLWEDDVWYLELLLYPPSTDDAYKIITTTIAGPATRWQMMRHWNVLNPGDHDYGMDDVKGPEQILIRNRRDLGQDRDYMARNFQIVSHLMTGKENPSGTDNPKRWRKWKMPNRDFSLLIMDSRLWRSSQDPAIWDDEGWGHDKELYSRVDPTRVLLGEEQFAWLQQEIKTDSSSQICLTGINALHTVWGGHNGNGWLNVLLDRDRVSADYAGWVKAGADRILDLLSSRDGVVSVYGDVHAGSIFRNVEKRLYECSFGPIGRWGGRSLIEGFGRKFQDFDGRWVECLALYHHEYKDPQLSKQDSKNYWNFLEMQFDPRRTELSIEFRIRNLTDAPNHKARGGGAVKIRNIDTGRKTKVELKGIQTLPNADILFFTRDGDPIRGARSLADGTLAIAGLVDIEPGSQIVMVASKDNDTESRILDL